MNDTTKGKNNEIAIIEWEDSYGATNGWIDLADYKPEILICISCGFVMYEDEKVVALAPNFATSTTYTPTQANGLMVIPKTCIRRITFSCFSLESTLTQPQI